MSVMGVKLKVHGKLEKTRRFLKKNTKTHNRKIFEECGQLGVEALAEATPKRTGQTAASWRYVIVENDYSNTFTLYWTNDNKTSRGDSIVIMLQYGHGTGTGGYVRGRDYINPAIQPIFDLIADRVWKAVIES